MSDNNFCNLNNIASCFFTLSSELDILGFTPVTYDEDNQKQCIVNLINLAWTLISDSKNKILKINELNEKILHLKRQSMLVEDAKRKCSLKLKNEQEKSLKLEETLSLSHGEKEKLLSEVKELKKDLNSANKGISGLELQYEHDMKKKEAFIGDLQSKLFRMSQVKNKFKTEKHIEEDRCESVDPKVFQKYVLALQNNIQTLLNENANLRASIINIYTSVMKSNQSPLNDDKHELLFKLPYQKIINEIEEGIKNTLKLGI